MMDLGHLEERVVATRVIPGRAARTAPIPAGCPEVLRRINAAIAAANGRLASFERIKRHAVLPEDFCIENDTLTPTLKIKRRVVAERHAREIDALYVKTPTGARQ